MEICTTGTSGITAERFFLQLKSEGVTSIVDTRMHPSSQLAGYSKKESLKYFANEILGIDYIHEPLLCPEPALLKDYRNETIDWNQYKTSYTNLLRARKLKANLNTSRWGSKPVLLCSEENPEHCHRRLAAEFLKTYILKVDRIGHL